MVDPIHINPNPVGPGGPGGSIRPDAASSPEGKSFKDFMLGKIDEVNRMKTESDRMVEDLVLERRDDVANVMNAVRQADLAFNMMMEIRNKLVDAYNQVMQMRV